MKSSLLSIALGISVTVASAQQADHLTCKTSEKIKEHARAMGVNPETDPSNVEYENYIREFTQGLETSRSGERSVVYVIPIVFHIVHVGGTENISDEQVHDAVAVLNRDFNKLNADTSAVVTEFKSNIANVGFEFRLAQKDALGNCVSGITRTFSSTTNEGTDDMVDQVNLNLNGGTSSSNIRFPRNKYLNIWVCKNADGAAGYTMTPASWVTPKYDGIWINHNYTGSIGTANPTTSRALTHEVGHWFNLRHTWGNTNNPGVSCGGDDLVADTPETAGWTSCNLSSNDNCNAGVVENVQNYMEYAYCSRMFTNGQKNRMVAAINSTTAQRSSLWTTSNLNAAGVNGTDNLCAADFKADETVICAGQSVEFTDQSYHGATSWSWNFTSGSPATSTAENPTVTYNTPGQYTVSLSSTNASGTQSETKTNFITVLPSTGVAPPIMEGFESMTTIPTTEWFIQNTDGQEAWQVVTGIGATGTKCVKLNNYAFNETGGKDVILSRTIDLSGASTAIVKFKYAYKQRVSTNNEKLKFFVSNNCGQTWSLRKQVVGTSLSSVVSSTAYNSPAAADWQSFEVTNITAAYFTEDFRFKIEFESDKGNNIYIDDINIDMNVGTDDITADNLEFNVYPNPVNSFANIEYNMIAAGKVEIKVTDVVGRIITVLENENKPAGNHKVQLSTSRLPSKGVYFVTLQAGNLKQTRKIVVE